MTPDAKLQIFAIKRGMIETRMDVNYYLPEYQCGIEKLKKVYSGKLRKISDFADVVCGPFGSAIKNADYQSAGIPLLRITNISADGNLDYKNIKFISKKLSDKLEKTQVTKGDIVVSQRGSLGLFAIIDDLYPILNISANLIAIKNVKDHDPEFIKNYLNSAICQKFLQQAQSGQIQSKITTADISNILVPEKVDEKKLNRIIVDGFSICQQKLQQAEELLAGMDEFVLDTLGIKPCSEAKKLCFAIKRKALDGVIDVKRHLGGMQLGTFKVQDIANIADQKINPQNFPDDIFDWIRIDDLPNHPLDITEIRTESGKNIEGTFFEVFPGDILVARLGPTILNRKTVMVRTTQRKTIASAEFLVLRCKEGYSPESVMAVIKTKFFVGQMYAHARGSTPSRYRLNREDMLSLPFPDISAVQEQIKAESIYRKKTAAKLRQEAEKEWQDAREQFEKELLGE